MPTCPRRQPTPLPPSLPPSLPLSLPPSLPLPLTIPPSPLLHVHPTYPTFKDLSSFFLSIKCHIFPTIAESHCHPWQWQLRTTAYVYLEVVVVVPVTRLVLVGVDRYNTAGRKEGLALEADFSTYASFSTPLASGTPLRERESTRTGE
jgi:hypothetical protein